LTLVLLANRNIFQLLENSPSRREQRGAERAPSKEDESPARMTLSKVLPYLVSQGAHADEESLVARLARAEPSAVGRVYDEHHVAVRAFARRLLGNDAAAEDLVQDVFVALPRVIAGFRQSSSLRTFLIGVAVNHARHHLRGVARRRAATERFAREPQLMSRTPEQDVRSRQLADLLSCALDELSLEHRATFVLCEVEERSSKEVAEITQVPEGTVRTRLHHAKKRLRSALEKAGAR
jgi:RNA polymerase sigma-70 factor (ECF subfamily)